MCILKWKCPREKLETSWAFYPKTTNLAKKKKKKRKKKRKEKRENT